MFSYKHHLKKIRYYPTQPDWVKNAYMPVSMNNRLLRDEDTLQEILGWIFERTDTCEAIIGDYLHRHNVIAAGYSEIDAVAICEELGKDSEERLIKATGKFAGKSLIITHVREFYSRPSYNNKFQYFSELYQRNKGFRKDIEYLIHQFLARQGYMEETPDRIQHCRDYLLEELCVFEILAEEGKLINIYPGKQLEVFKNIVSGDLKQISPMLEKTTLVEMKFKFSAKK